MVLFREDTAKHKMDPWDVDGLMKEAFEGENRMRDLETREFTKTFRRMSCFPRGPKGLKLTRGDGTTFLSDCFSIKHLNDLQDKFWGNKFHTMAKDEFYNWIKMTAPNANLEDEHFHKLFNMIDLDLDGVISWEELVYFFEMEFIDKYNLVNGYIAPSTAEYIKGPTIEVHKSHKQPIASVLFWPSVNQHRKIEPFAGKYISASKEGVLDVFNLNLEYQYSRLGHCNEMSSRFRTQVTTGCIMPEINILCLGSMERYLRFYDVAHEKMELLYEISNYENAITEMIYKFYEDKDKKSFMAIGDTNGGVTAILFKTDRGGPFKKAIGQPVQTIRWHNLRAGGVPELEVVEFRKVHKRWVECLKYSEELNCLISCSNSCPRSLVLLDVKAQAVLNTIDVPEGISCADTLPPPPEVSTLCFTGIDEPKVVKRNFFNRWMVTGGLDTRLRVWDLNDTRKPKAVMTGHISRIKFLIVQTGEREFPLIVSYGRIGRITVWNGLTYEFVQLYTSGLGGLAQTKPISICYNPDFKMAIFASYKMIAVRLGEHRDKNVTAGTTHQTEISAVLYNTVYHVIITTSLDSSIIRWNPFTGQKEMVILAGHTDRLVYGERSYPITVATFNPEQNLLATGASDGSIKIWDFFRGLTMKQVHSYGPVSHIIWLKSRIMAVSYGKKVRVWENSLSYDEDYRDLATRNHADISAIAYVEPSYILIGTVGGQLLFCDAGSGSPVKTYLVHDPLKDLHIDVEYRSALRYEESKNLKFDRGQYEKCGSVGKIGINLIYLLTARTVRPDVGNLVVSLDTGVLQFWSTHPEGGFIAAYYAVHRPDDVITTIASDKENSYLFTGTALGYLKLWLLTDFALPEGKKPLMAALRLQFCFLVSEDMMGHAKKAASAEVCPLLLNCYRAHTSAITATLFIDSSQIVITGGGDKCVRYWTLTGQFLNSLDSILSWIRINPFEPVKAVEFRIPTDLRRILSATTLKVLSRDFRCLEAGDEEPEIEDDSYKRRIESRTTSRQPFGSTLTLDTIGRYFDPPQLPQQTLASLPDLEDNFECVLKNLPLLKTEKVPWIKPPKIIRSMRKRLEHTILSKKKKHCYECKEERKERGGLDLPYNQGISLERGVKLRKRAEKEGKKKKSKYEWKCQKKRYKDPIKTPFSTKLFGKSDEDIAEAFGDIVKGASSNDFEFTFFGLKVPKSKRGKKKFIRAFAKKMAIEDSAVNRKMISTAIDIAKRNFIGKMIEELKLEDKQKTFDFDCLTEKEKKELVRKRLEFVANLDELDDTAENLKNLDGLYSLISDCLYDTKFMELPDNELLALLTDLCKPVDPIDGSASCTQVGCKKRQESSEKTRRRVNTSRKCLTKDSPIKQFVRKLMDERLNVLEITNEDICDQVTTCVKEILRKEPCPTCGARKDSENLSISRLKKTESERSIPREHISNGNSENQKSRVKKRKPFLSILKSCLIKANLGEMKEEDVENKVSEFLMDIVNQCKPSCKRCNKRTFNYIESNEKKKAERIIDCFKTVSEFKKPKQRHYEKKLTSYFNKVEIFKKREKEMALFDLENTFREMKKVNLEKLNNRLVRLDNEYVQIKGFSEHDNQKRKEIREEIKSTKAKLDEESKRTLE